MVRKGRLSGIIVVAIFSSCLGIAPQLLYSMMPTAALAGHFPAFYGGPRNCTCTVFLWETFCLFPFYGTVVSHTKKKNRFISFEVHNLHGHGSGQFLPLQALKTDNIEEMEVFSKSEGPNSMSHYWAAFSCCIHLTPSVVFLSLCRLRPTAWLWFSVSVFLLSVSHVSRRSLKTDSLRKYSVFHFF